LADADVIAINIAAILRLPRTA